MRVLKSIGDKRGLEHEQTVQKASNCYAKRLQASQKYLLGDRLYRKFRQYTFKEIHDHLLKDAKLLLKKREYKKLKKKLEEVDDESKWKFKTLDEKYKTIGHLKNMMNFPTTVKDWYHIIRLIRHNYANIGEKFKLGENIQT